MPRGSNHATLNEGEGVSRLGEGVLCQPQVQQWHSQNKSQRCGDGNH